MDHIRRHASQIVDLRHEYSVHHTPARLVFESAAADFEHFYAGSYHSSTTVRRWYSREPPANLMGTPESYDFELGQVPTASLRVVAIPSDREQRRILHINRLVFQNLFRAMFLDNYGLYLYLTKTPGFHRLGPMKTSTSNGNTVTPSAIGFYLNAVDYTIIWSYCQRTRAVNAILVGNVDQVLQAMTTTEDQLIFHPLYLAFFSCYHQFLHTWECDANKKPKGDDDWASLETLEVEHLDSSNQLNEVSRIGLSLARALITGTKNLEILKNLRDVLDQLHCCLCEGNSVWGELDRRTREIQDGLGFLKHQIASRIAHFERQTEVAGAEFRVVGPLVSRQPGSGPEHDLTHSQMYHARMAP